MTTLCRDCDLVHGATRGRDWWKWRCLAVPIQREPNFVNPDHEPDAPYEKCSAVNFGDCLSFTPLREAPQS